MWRFLVARVLRGVGTVAVATFVLFGVIELMPGDPIRVMFGFGRVDPVAYEAIANRMHFDEPYLVRYWLFFRDTFTLNLGDTMRGQPIIDILRDTLPTSLVILGGVFLLQLLVAPLLIWVAGMRPRTPLDRLSNSATIVLVSVPTIVAAFLIQAIGAYWTDLFASPTWLVDDTGGWRNFVMPVLALGLGTSAHLAMVGRVELLHALAQPYAVTARAFGLPHGRIVSTQALRPAAGPIIQLLAANMAVLITGLIVVEDIFMAPGVGRTLLEAIHDSERILVITMLMFVVVGVVIANTLADMVHGILDPRVRQG